jgi:hypothetical protein
METTTWKDLHAIVLSELSEPIPTDFKVAAANRSKKTRPPSKFDLHLSERSQLRFVKWAPNLVEQGMKNLRELYANNTPASDPGRDFWLRTSINDNVAELEGRVVTGERQIQSIMDRDLLDPLCSVASKILFYLDAKEPGRGRWYHGLKTQTGDLGPPLWDTVVKLSENESIQVTGQIIPILVERIILGLELKSLSVAPSTFFYRLCCRAAANVLKEPKRFEYQTCKNGVACSHNKRRDIRRSLDMPIFFDTLKELPQFNPNPEEFKQLLADIRILNDDQADNSGPIHTQVNHNEQFFAEHPCARVALAIMRTGAISLAQDTNGDVPDTQMQTMGGNDFEEHYACVLRQVNQYSSLALTNIF